ncbi:MAG: oligogalacturonate lyase family protein [Clostridiales bacterium]|nr:oligogalacturonate lyase family protein [Clostridiales bacterium]MDR2752623.1 oligogalacturonate lyase family protein [Clostridiales bacterium]
MNELFEYKDDQTGYVIKQYTNGNDRCDKLYFTTESFVDDDQSFFYKRKDQDPKKCGLYRVDYASGDQELILGDEYTRMAIDYLRPYLYAVKGLEVWKLETGTGKLEKVGELPPGVPTGHLSASKSGIIWSSYHLANKIYALVRLDPKVGVGEVMWKDDHVLGHCQACPGDDDSVMYIHETTGDALQRIWMYDVPTKTVRPYYVEKEGDWITHEVWTADGDFLQFMRYPHDIIQGTRDGHNFKVMASSKQYLHSAPDRAGKFITADRISGVYCGTINQVSLIDAKTGEEEVLANLEQPKTGAEHPHPSFNRKGNVVLFNRPIANSFCNVCAVDLEQVKLFKH